MHKIISIAAATFIITANTITPASLSRADTAWRGGDAYSTLSGIAIPHSTCYAPGIKPLPGGRRTIPLQARPKRGPNSKRVHAFVYQSTPSRVWVLDITDANNGNTKLNPSGARMLEITPELEWRAATGTGDDASGFMLLINGISQTPDGCYSDGAGGGGSPWSSPCGSLNVVQVQETTVSNKVYYSDPIDAYWPCSNDPQEFPKDPNKKCKSCGGQSGDPVDVQDGALRHEHDDISLSGPFGLEFHRYYNSKSAIAENGNRVQDSEQGEYFPNDVGFGWQHSYSAFLDMTQLNAGNSVTFYDEQFHRIYFGGVAPGQTVTEPIDGASMYESSDSTTYKVTLWNGTAYQFTCCYHYTHTPWYYIAYLTSITDRLGNTQTIARNSSLQITSVTDVLGRSLNFTYNSSGEITQVASSPSGAKITLAYNSGTNCTTGELCSATENNGSVWNYQYVEDNVAQPGALYTEISHDLTAVQDPNSNYEEQNTYEILTPTGWQRGTTYALTQKRGGQNSLTFTYPSAPYNTTTTIKDGLNRTTTYTIDSYLRRANSISGGPACQACGGNQSVTYVWDNFNRLVSYTDGDGSTHTITYTYGDDTPRTYPDGTKYVVDPVLHVTAVTEPLSSGKTRVTNYAWYPFGDPRQDLINVTTIPSADTSGNSKTITDTYSTTGLLQSEAVTGYVSGVSQTRTVNFAYDTAGRGRLTQITGPRTDVTQQTTLSYYPDTDSDLARRGQLQTITRQVSTGKTLATNFASDVSPNNTYKIYGNPLSATDPNGVIVDLGYDNIGELTSRTIKGVTGDTTPLVTSYSYDPGHRLTSVTWPLTNGVQYGYDASNDLSTVTRTSASTNYQEERISLGYDVMSQLTSQLAQSCATPATTCGSWNTTQQETFKPDTYGRLSEVDHPCQPTCYKILYTHDAAGNLTKVQDENHTVANTTNSYDYANRLTKVTQTLGSGNVATNYGYDIQNNIDSLTDPNTNHTTYTFTDFGELRQQVSPVSGTSKYIYDYDRNLTQYTDANAAVTNATYDAIDRILTAVSTRTGVPTDNVSWTYDNTGAAFGQGRLTSVTDPSGSNSYSYDRRGMVKTESPIIASNSYSLSYGYDLNGNRTTLTYPGGTTATYGYDFADRPYSVKWGSTQIVTSAAYEPFGPLANIIFGNGATQALSYTQRYQPAENKLTTGSTLADYVYAEDGVGNVTQITDNVHSAYDRVFGYDDLNRLTTANSGSSLWGTAIGNGYSYDNMGNIKTIRLGTAHTASFTYSGNLPELTQATDSTENDGVGQSISYDAAGNETAIGSDAYAYSARNLLKSVTTLTYTYDSRGVRTTTVDSGVGTRYSLYNSDRSLLAESSLTSNAMIYNYVWFAGRPVAQVNTNGGTSIYYNFTDHLGTPEIQTSSTGSINWQAEYEPYGRVFALRASDVHQPLRPPGQVAEQFDTGANGATEKSYNLFRWYNPTWGMYSQADPTGLISGSDLYAALKDNPLVYSDVAGLNVLLGFAPGGALGFGHSFMVIYDPTSDPLMGTLYEFTSSNGGIGGVDGKVNEGTVYLDEPPSFDDPSTFGDYEQYQMFNFETSASQDQAMKQYWNNLSAATVGVCGAWNSWICQQNYNFLTSNCIEQVAAALRVGAAAAPANVPNNYADLNQVAALLGIYPNMAAGELILNGYTPVWPESIEPR